MFKQSLVESIKESTSINTFNINKKIFEKNEKFQLRKKINLVEKYNGSNIITVQTDILNKESFINCIKNGKTKNSIRITLEDNYIKTIKTSKGELVNIDVLKDLRKTQRKIPGKNRKNRNKDKNEYILIKEYGKNNNIEIDMKVFNKCRNSILRYDYIHNGQKISLKKLNLKNGETINKPMAVLLDGFLKNTRKNSLKNLTYEMKKSYFSIDKKTKQFKVFIKDEEQIIGYFLVRDFVSVNRIAQKSNNIELFVKYNNYYINYGKQKTNLKNSGFIFNEFNVFERSDINKTTSKIAVDLIKYLRNKNNFNTYFKLLENNFKDVVLYAR